MYEIPLFRHRSLGTRADIRQAERIYSNVILQSEGKHKATAMYELSVMLESIADENNDLELYERAFSLLLHAADGGCADAQHELAAAYHTGIHAGMVPVDAGR